VKSRVDIGTIAAFVATGGMAGAALGLGQLFPAHASQINSVALIVVAIAGLVRTITNPTPTNTVQVFDRATSSMVDIKTVAAPSAQPAPPPTYAVPKGP
jgi:Protein of unknown function (DUF2964)